MSSKEIYHQYSRHVSSALSPDKIEFYRTYPSYVKKRFPTIKPEWFVDITTGIHNGVAVFPWVEKYIKSMEPVIDPTFSSRWNLVWNSTKTTLELQIESLTQGLSKTNYKYMLNILEQMSKSQNLLYAGKTKTMIINVHNEIEQESELGKPSFFIPLLPGIEFVGDLIVLHRFPGGPIIITYQMLANCLDKLEAQFSWLFYMEYTDLQPANKDIKILDLFREIYDILEEAYANVGNDAIRVCKLLEPLLVGLSLGKLNPVTHDQEFGGIIKQSLSEEWPHLQSYVDKIWNVGEAFLARLGTRGIPYLIEQYGQEKLHNYPIVSIEAGLKKMHLYGTSIRISDDQAVRDIAANFKREYFVAFYEKHKVLPKIIDNWRLDSRIRNLIKQGKPGSIRECYRIPNEAWFLMEFNKNHEFNYFPQISDLLDDKAITPHLDHIHQLFAQDALNVMNLRKPFTRENTRLILEILQRPVIDIKKFYDEVEKLGSIPTNWAIIQLMAKERELKIDARTFSILTFECRMMASACERNLGEHILPLFKQQSMTLSGSELKHKMDVLTTLPETTNHIWIVFHHDLQQWNYTFRSYQQAHLNNVLCDLFGVNHFRYLMHIFTDSKLFSANKFTPPGFPGKWTEWDTHAGGNQGILQKLWTLITIVVIRNVMHTMDLEHRLNGSGDNQVLFVRLLKNDKLPDMIVMIKNKLRDAFVAIGLALKLEETWTSKDLICYQRKYYFRGILIPGGIKISARAFSGTGDINAGLNAVITTAINGGIGLTDQHSDPLIGPSFAYVEILINLLYHQEWSKVVPVQLEPIVVLTMLSSDFGFLPFVQLTGFLYAGHQDTLSESLSLLKYVWEHYPKYRPIIAGAIQFKMGTKDADSKLQLILEPTTLNIDRPKLPEAYIRDKVEDYLMNPSNVVNTQLRIMFDACKREDQTKLAEELLKIKPLNTALLHSLFECSHIGSLLGTFSRFNKISSLVRLIGLNKVGSVESCFSARVRQLDRRNLEYFFRRIRPKMNHRLEFIEELVSFDTKYYHQYCLINKLHQDCVFSARIFLIASSFGLGFNFITGPYTPPPSEQVTFHDTGIPRDTRSSLVINPSYNIPETILELEQKRGCYSMYIGSRTADPVRAIRLTTLDGIEAGTAIKTLLKILAWMKSTNSAQNIVEFITTQLGVRMEGLEDLIPGLVPGTAGGCIDHRFGSPGTVMWAFSNSTTVISTWYQITSNRATELQRGEEDRFVFFQQIYHHIYSALRFCDPYHHRFTANIRLDHCSYIIPKSQFESPKLALPGQHSLLGGLILDPERKEALRQEADHFTSVMRNSILHSGTGEEIICAVIGYEVAHNILLYSLGLENLNQEDHRVAHNQSTINLTLLRKLPLNKILMSIAMHLAVEGYFGRPITYNKLIRKLISRGRLGTATQSVTPFLDIIQGIITSGHLPGLLNYSRSYWKWDSSTSLINLTGPLLLAMARSLEDHKRHPYQIYLLNEVRGNQYNYHKLIRFLYCWSPIIRHTIHVNQALSGINLIDEINKSSWELQVLLVTDKGIAVEYGRRILKSSDEVRTPEPGENHGTPIQPKISRFSTPSWLHSPPTTNSLDPTHWTAFKMLGKHRSDWHLATRNLTKLMRWNKASSSGRYKLMEIIARLSLRIHPDDFFVTLAEGQGSFLSLLLHLYPQSKAVYNSKVQPDNTPPSMASVYIPPELLCECSLSGRVVNLPELSSTYGDLLHSTTWEELNSHIRYHSSDNIVLTFDMQYIPRDTGLVLEKLIHWIKIWMPKVVIMKLTMELIVETELPWLSDICSHFALRDFIKPCFSNPYSTEVYLVLQTFNKIPIYLDVFTLESLITDWLLLPWCLTDATIGRTLQESLVLNWTSQHCPSYLTQFIKHEVDNMGSIYSLLKNSLVYLFRSLYTKYWLLRDLDRTEQTVLHSTSIQAINIRVNFYAITKSLELYIHSRGVILSETAHKWMLSNIARNPGDLLGLLDQEEKKSPSKQGWNTVIQLLGSLLSSPDSLILDYSIELILAWLWLSLYEDRFSIFLSYPVENRTKLYNSLLAAQGHRNLEWLDLILRPSNFFLINRLLLDLLGSLRWPHCLVTCAITNLKELMEELPWHPQLCTEDSHEIILTGTLNDVVVDWKAARISLPIMIVVGETPQLGSEPPRVLLLKKTIGLTSFCVYSH